MEPLILDTGVLIAGAVPPDRTTAISALTLAELEFGLVAAVRRGGTEVLRRSRLLEAARVAYGEGIPLTGAVAGAYGRITEAELAARRNPRARTVDLLIAATALHHGAPLATTNPADYASLRDLVEIVPIRP